MEENILVVPDVHGRTFWRKVINSDLPVIFLGDYTDPYTVYEGISEEQALQEFKYVIDFAKENQNRVVLLLGNHMLHYVGLSDDTCRFDWNHSKEIYNIMKENQSLFRHAYKWNNTLFTHAGVTEGWLKQSGYSNDPNTIEDQLNKNIIFTDEFLISPSWYGLGDLQDPRGDIGESRGGYKQYGSPNWADLSEMYKDSAFKDSLIQIIGHTQLRETGDIYHKDNFYCCDSRDVFVWNDKELKQWNNDN